MWGAKRERIAPFSDAANGGLRFADPPCMFGAQN
jgi:hypothetical protein